MKEYKLGTVVKLQWHDEEPELAVLLKADYSLWENDIAPYTDGGFILDPSHVKIKEVIYEPN